MNCDVATKGCLGESQITYAEEVRLVVGATRIAWRPHSLLQERLNLDGVPISASATLVFLFVRSCPELMLSPMIDQHGVQMLFLLGTLASFGVY